MRESHARSVPTHASAVTPGTGRANQSKLAGLKAGERSMLLPEEFGCLTDAYKIQENWLFGSNKSNVGTKFLNFGTRRCQSNHPI